MTTYKTKYELKVYKGNRRLEEIIEESENFEGLYEAIYNNGETMGATVWASHEKDMIELSEANRGIVFALHGTGEEQGDIWIKYFKNGLMQTSEAKITFAPYNEDKLI